MQRTNLVESRLFEVTNWELKSWTHTSGKESIVCQKLVSIGDEKILIKSYKQTFTYVKDSREYMYIMGGDQNFWLEYDNNYTMLMCTKSIVDLEYTKTIKKDHII